MPALGVKALLMWSQPYDLNLYRAYTGVGVAGGRGYNFTQAGGLFYSMYYDSGTWVRRPAGEESRYRMNGLEVEANLTHNTYKPIMLWTISEVILQCFMRKPGHA